MKRSLDYEKVYQSRLRVIDPKPMEPAHIVVNHVNGLELAAVSDLTAYDVMGFSQRRARDLYRMGLTRYNSLGARARPRQRVYVCLQELRDLSADTERDNNKSPKRMGRVVYV